MSYQSSRFSSILISDEMGGDDLIATKLLKMSQISFSSTDSDLGFQPTFGPSYIPMYGALREFTEFNGKHEDLNKGDVSFAIKICIILK